MRDNVNTKPPYLCIDCGVPVKRRVKRCKECHVKALPNRATYERTPEHNQMMSERLKGTQPNGTGWKHSPETRRKIAASWTPEKREAARKRGNEMAQDREWRLRIARALSGENNPMWQGGIMPQPYAPGFSKTLKNCIRKRDQYTCQLCGMTEKELGYKLSIHHSDYDKTNHDESNLFATCKRCNSLVNTNREIWEVYFFALAERRQLGKDVSELIGRQIVSQRVGFIHISDGSHPDLGGIFADIIAEHATDTLW